MRLLIASNLYGRLARGGAERIAEREAAGLRTRGHEVAVVSGVPSGAPLVSASADADSWSGLEIGHERSADGVELFTYFPPNFCFYTELSRRSWPVRLAWHWLDIFNRRSAARLLRVVDGWRPDVVHTHNLMGLGFAVPSALRRRGVRHVHTVHDVQLLHPSGLLPADWTGPRWPHERAYVRLMRRMMGSPAVVLWPSEFVRDLHLRLGFFPHSEHVLLRNPAPEAIVVRQPSVAGRNFLFVGQMEEHKGILDLLTAWSRRTFGGGAKLVIVGDGSLSGEVRRRTEGDPSIELLGRLSSEQLNKEYCRADWLVVPSRVIENAPTVIGEALAYGLPVIAARSGGIPELVREGENGLLFTPGDTAELESVLHKAIDTKLSASSSIDLTSDNYLDFLEGLFG
ncbi:MAG: glycosyltransferase [bacterium]